MNCHRPPVLKCYSRWSREQHGDEALGLLLVVTVSALLAGLTVVRISRRRQSEAGNSVASSE
jgi:hypothetical protein